MCDLIEAADYVRRNGYGLPVHPDTELMGANDMSESRRERRRICDELEQERDGKGVPDWVRETVAENDRKRTFERALFWSLLTGLWFGLMIGFAVCLWWLS